MPRGQLLHGGVYGSLCHFTYMYIDAVDSDDGVMVFYFSVNTKIEEKTGKLGKTKNYGKLTDKLSYNKVNLTGV